MSKKESKTAEKRQKMTIKSKYLTAMNEALKNSSLCAELEEMKATAAKLLELPEETKEALAKIDKFLQSDEYKAIKEQQRRLTAFIEEHRAELTAQTDAERLAPFLQLELESSTEYAQYVLEDIIEQYTKGGKITDRQIMRIIERAKKRQAEYEESKRAVETLEQVRKELQPFVKIFNNAPLNDLITARQDAYKWVQLHNEHALEAKNNNTKITIDAAGLVSDEEETTVIENTLNALRKKAGAPTWALFMHTLVKLCAQLPANKPGDLLSVNEALEMGSIYVSIKDYAKLRNITEDRARQQINDAGAFLYRQDITNDYMMFKKNGKKEREPFHARLFSFWDPGIGVAKFVFSQEIVKYFLKHPQIGYVSTKIFQIDLKKFAHAFFMYYKMSIHHGMNVQKSNSNLLSVASLLDATPSLPSYEEAGKRVGQLIRDPFEKNLNYLKDNGFLVDWNYCGKDMAELPDSKHSTLKYADWINLNIDFEIADYPEDTQQERLAKKAEQIEERKRKQAIKEELALERKEARERKKAVKN